LAVTHIIIIIIIIIDIRALANLTQKNQVCGSRVESIPEIITVIVSILDHLPA